MSAMIPHWSLPTDKVLELMDFFENAITLKRLESSGDLICNVVSRVLSIRLAFLYVPFSPALSPRLFQTGIHEELLPSIEKVCSNYNDIFSKGFSDSSRKVSVSCNRDSPVEITLYPLRAGKVYYGIMGLALEEETSNEFLQRYVRIIAETIQIQTEQSKRNRELSNLNKYLTVSSMIAQSLDIHELLDITLNSAMEAVSAEAASVLLLDDEKKKFYFYEIEGPAKPVLMKTTFPADKGIAGAVLESQQSEVINNVHDDPRFYGKIDDESGFVTRNMMVIPLIAGEEKIGVLEVLNKKDDAPFTDEEHIFLQMIAEEIAFAIRNAKIFDYVVNSYCKQRQGLNTCKGCKRPLGSWTPCVKYQSMNDTNY